VRLEALRHIPGVYQALGQLQKFIHCRTGDLLIPVHDNPCERRQRFATFVVVNQMLDQFPILRR